MLNKEFSEYRRNFYNTYYSDILPLFAKFEKERKLNFWLTFLGCFASAVFFISGIALPLYFMFDPDKVGTAIVLSFCIFPIFTILGGVFFFWFPKHMNSKFAQKLKITCMPCITQIFGHMKWYDQYNLISDSMLRSAQLFANYDGREHYDAFKGSYKGVEFKIEETYMYVEASNSSKSVSKADRDAFRGVVIEFPVNKNVKNTTIIATKNDTNIRNGYANFFQLAILISLFLMSILFITCRNIYIDILVPLLVGFIIFKGAKNEYLDSGETKELNELKLEDPEFSKKYRVYSADQVEGRYLVTPAFMERFKNLQTAFGSKNAKCSFYKDSLIFAISTKKNLFEIGNLFHSLENPKQMTEFFNELSSILALIDYFKLNEKTGL